MLWALLPAPAPAIQPRAAPDAAGQAYLDALSAPAPAAPGTAVPGPGARP
jgi:hypothetical protein